jgi:hypothetical protein
MTLAIPLIKKVLNCGKTKALCNPVATFRLMRIITWNCNMAYRKKADFILTEQSDIFEAVVGIPVRESVPRVANNKGASELYLFCYSNYHFFILRRYFNHTAPKCCW